jgi:hypothetical protein
MYDSSMSDTGPLVETAVSDQETETRADPEISRAKEQLALARERMLSAALAFCDGTISAGQLRAVRELLREQDLRLTQLEGETPPVFVEDMAVEEFVSEDSLTERSIEETLKMEIETQDAPELMEMLSNIDEKIERLEDDFENGRINGSQYRAIRRHYQEQREVAMRLKEAHPSSDRWRVVLEEGRTTFLMQLNEALCTCVALYDLKDRNQIFIQGEMPDAAEEAMGLLRTFGPPRKESGPGRMLATHLDDGSGLLLIPGIYTAVLALFSQDPPGWQVRALKEVLLNFEAANRAALRKSEHKKLVFPDLRRFVKAS